MEKIKVDAAAVTRALGQKDCIVVDARSAHAFNGWRLEGESGEGHIKGAANFAADWLRFPAQDSARVEKMLLEKLARLDLTPEKSVIIYDFTGRDAPLVRDYLKNRGIDKLSYFPLSQWRGEMAHYPGYASLVPPQWVKALIDGGSPEFFAGRDYRIFQVSWGAPSPTFLAGHIPGAVHIDSEDFEVGPEWVRVADDKLEEFACRYGITAGTTVVLYGYNGLGVGAAAKLGVVLNYMGVKQVCLLNGTFDNWVALGYPVEKGANQPVPCETFGGKIPADPSALVDIAEAKRILADPSLGQVIDTRGWRQFIGEDSGYTYVPKAGRIPGAIWCWDEYNYTNPDGTMRDIAEIAAHWRGRGIDATKRMAFFCGSASWGAAVVELYGRAAGYPNATIYEGGWCQWQLDPNNPYETGVPENTRQD
jgi:thiosulfate/3-mercaptopyruvate sulfurtransferase